MAGKSDRALRYGGKVHRDVVPTGAKVLKVFERDPRACRGNLLAKRAFPLAAGEDLTIVVTRKAPRVVIFDNNSLGVIPPDGGPVGYAILAWPHAAEIAVSFKVRVWSPDNDGAPLDPDFDRQADPVWVKGDELIDSSVPDRIWKLWATLPDSPDAVAGPTRVDVRSDHRYEWVLVGTKPSNARYVLLVRRISSAVP